MKSSLQEKNDLRTQNRKAMENVRAELSKRHEKIVNEVVMHYRMQGLGRAARFTLSSWQR